MKKVTILLGVLLLVGAGCSDFKRGHSSVDDISFVEPGRGELPLEIDSDFSQLPDLTLQDYDGNNVELRDYIGTPLVVNSWASWCPFCKKELPDFVEIQEEFVGEVVFIAINRKESLKKAKGYTDENGLTDDLIFLLDSGDAFYTAIAGFSMPETIFVDADGNITEVKRGVLTLEETREKVQNLLGK